MWTKQIFVSATVFMFVGCVTLPSPADNESETEQRFTSLILVRPGGPQDGLELTVGHSSVLPNEFKARLRDSCGLAATSDFDPEAIGSIALAVLVPFVKSAIGTGLDALGKRLKSALEDYSAKYDAAAWDRSFEDSATESRPECLRFVHGRRTGQTETVDLEFILRLKHVEDGFFELDPLFFYFANPTANKRSINHEYGVAINVSARTTSREPENLLFSSTVYSETHSLPEEEYLAFDLTDTNDTQCVEVEESIHCYAETSNSLVQLPVQADGESFNQPVLFSMTAVEVGTPSRGLTIA